MRGTIAAITAALAVGFSISACAPIEDSAALDTAPTTTTADPAPVTTRPPPSELATRLDAIYPGIADHADDWARYTCREIEKGERDPAIYVAQLVANPETRPHPTPEQVTAMLAAIEPTC